MGVPARTVDLMSPYTWGRRSAIASKVSKEVHLGVGNNLSKTGPTNTKELEELVIPVERLETAKPGSEESSTPLHGVHSLHEHCSRGVGHIGEEYTTIHASCETPEKPSVDRTEEQVVLVVSVLDRLDVVQEPSQETLSDYVWIPMK